MGQEGSRTRWYLEVERDQGENKSLQVLHEVVKDPQTLGVI